MSIYGGFGLRKAETKYNGCLEQMLELLSKKVIGVIDKESNENMNEFKLKFGKIYCVMKNMEEHKYLPPKFSDCLGDLADLIGIDFEFYEKQQKTHSNL